jgi:Tfp pilus assembly protein PilV
MKKHRNHTGFMLIEALISVAVFALMVTSIIPVLNFMFKQSTRSKYEQEASLLVQEGLEVSYNLFTADWEAYPAGETYHPALFYTGPGSEDFQWTLETGSDAALMTRYNRSITIENVCRSSTTGQSVSPCTYPDAIDPNSRLVKTKVTWVEASKPKEVMASLLLVNLEQ